MIFATVGAQLPFDRLGSILNNFVINNCFTEEIIFQSFSNTQFSKLKCVKQMPSEEYLKTIRKSRLVISHAGIGTMITCTKEQKPLIIFPRLHKYKEHRNDHQLDSAKKFKKMKSLRVALTQTELTKLIINFDNESYQFDNFNASKERLQHHIQNLINDI